MPPDRFGWIGRLAHVLLILRNLERIFDFRSAFLIYRFETIT
jgi:hypothetical protein